MKYHFQEFLSGLTKPSAISLGLCAVLLATCFGAVVLSGERLRLAGIESYFERAPLGIDREDSLSVTRAWQEIQASTDDKLLVFLGASSNRESLSSAGFIEHSLKEQTGKNWKLINLTGSGQSLLESILLARNLPADFDGAVVFGVNLLRMAPLSSRLQRRLAYPEYGMGLPGWWQMGESVGLPARGTFSATETLKPYFTLMLLRMARQSILRDIAADLKLLDVDHSLQRARARNYYEETDRQNPRGWQSNAEATLAALADPDNASGLIAVELGETLDALTARNLPVFLLDSPINPRFLEEVITPGRYGEYIRHAAKVADQHGAHYLDLREQTRLEEDDFFDWAHLKRDAARQRYTQALAKELGPYLIGVSAI